MYRKALHWRILTFVSVHFWKFSDSFFIAKISFHYFTYISLFMLFILFLILHYLIYENIFSLFYLWYFGNFIYFDNGSGGQKLLKIKHNLMTGSASAWVCKILELWSISWYFGFLAFISHSFTITSSHIVIL